MEQNWHAAIADYSAVLDRAKWADVYHWRGNAYSQLSLWSFALADLTEALTLVPANPDLFDLRARVYDGLQRYEEAGRDRARAAALRPPKS
jgi:tetratricopeptide (TPR) repeat protein